MRPPAQADGAAAAAARHNRRRWIRALRASLPDSGCLDLRRPRPLAAPVFPREPSRGPAGARDRVTLLEIRIAPARRMRAAFPPAVPRRPVDRDEPVAAVHPAA